MKHIQLISSVMGLVLCFFIFPIASNALTTLTVGPTHVVLKIKPGEKKSFSVIIENPSQESIIVKPSLGLFESKVGDEGGAIEVLKASEGSPATWVSLPKDSFRLSPGDRSVAVVDVSLPKDIAGGGYNVVIEWHARLVDEESEQVRVRQIVRTLLLFDVDGPERVEKAELVSLSASGGQIIGGQSFFFQQPVPFLVRVKNLGNVPIKPVGEIRIKNIFGQTVEVLPFNQNKIDAGGYVPQNNGVRAYRMQWLNNFAFGRYTALLYASHNGEERTLTGAIVLWVLPITLFILACGAICVIMILLILIARKKIHSRSLRT